MYPRNCNGKVSNGLVYCFASNRAAPVTPLAKPRPQEILLRKTRLHGSSGWRKGLNRFAVGRRAGVPAMAFLLL